MQHEKPRLNLAALEAQTAFELPARETMQIVVVITDVLSGNTIDIDVTNNKVALQVCALVNVINVLAGSQLTCTTQR